MPIPISTTRTIRILLSGFAIMAVAFFSLLMARIVWPYTSGAWDIDFLLTKQHIIHLRHYRWSFYLHIFPALLVLLAGLTQFSGRILRQTPSLHRWAGRVYVYSVLGICGPAAMVMAFYANGGWLAKTSFVILSGLWWGCTWVAYRAIRRSDVRRHGAWMIRSYALTFSAVTLRVMQFGLATYSDMDPETAYRLVAWPSWIFNWLVAEWVLTGVDWMRWIYPNKHLHT